MELVLVKNLFRLFRLFRLKITIMETVIKRTTKEDQKIALSSLPDFQVVSKRIKSSQKNGVKIKIQESGEFCLFCSNPRIFLVVFLVSSLAKFEYFCRCLP